MIDGLERLRKKKSKIIYYSKAEQKLRFFQTLDEVGKVKKNKRMTAA